MPRFDFSKVSDTNLVPEGDYEAVFVGGRLGQSKANQPKMTLEWTIQEGEFNGRKAFRDYSMQENSLWAFKGVMTEMGVDADEFSNPEGIDPEEMCAGVVGTQCLITIKHNTYSSNGQTKTGYQVGGVKSKSRSVWG